MDTKDLKVGDEVLVKVKIVYLNNVIGFKSNNNETVFLPLSYIISKVEEEPKPMFDIKPEELKDWIKKHFWHKVELWEYGIRCEKCNELYVLIDLTDKPQEKPKKKLTQEQIDTLIEMIRNS